MIFPDRSIDPPMICSDAIPSISGPYILSTQKIDTLLYKNADSQILNSTIRETTAKIREFSVELLNVSVFLLFRLALGVVGTSSNHLLTFLNPLTEEVSTFAGHLQLHNPGLYL